LSVTPQQSGETAMTDFLRRRGPTAIAVALAFVAGGAGVTTAQNLITGADIKDGSIKAADLANGAVNSSKIADGQVGKADLGSNAVNSAKIVDGQVLTADIGNNAVNSAKIADGQVKSADLANGGVAKGDLASNAVNSAKIVDGQVLTADIGNNAVTSAKIADGTIEADDISPGAQESLTAYTGANWGVIDRNVINNGDAYLRAGPSHAAIPPAGTPQVPPFGVGSLGIRTGGRDNATGGPSDDKAAFGNQVDFARTLVSDLTAVSFYVYTTAENIASGAPAVNMPNIAIEISANLLAVPGPVDFTTMQYEPGAQLPVAWIQQDAVADDDPHWRLTGEEGEATGCNQVTACTFAEVIAALTADDVTDGEPALIGTVAISKGRDFAFSGAVDALQINDTVYDFEPNGVFATPAAP
jgi:hypothetical protein